VLLDEGEGDRRSSLVLERGREEISRFPQTKRARGAANSLLVELRPRGNSQENQEKNLREDGTSRS